MKKLITIEMLCVLLFSFSIFYTTPIFAEANQDDFEKTALNFIKYSFNDTTGELGESEKYISKDANTLRQMMQLRHRILTASTAYDRTLSKIEFDNVEVLNKNDDSADIFIEAMLSFNNPNDKELPISYSQNFYRILLKKEDSGWKVAKAVSSDFSSTAIYPQFACNESAVKNYDMNNYDKDSHVDGNDIVGYVAEFRNEAEKAQEYYVKNKSQIDMRNQQYEEEMYKKYSEKLENEKRLLNGKTMIIIMHVLF